MHYDPFEVQVITEPKVSTQQKIITSLLVGYLLLSVSGVALALYFSFTKSV
jgi:hypothetical protein